MHGASPGFSGRVGVRYRRRKSAIDDAGKGSSVSRTRALAGVVAAVIAAAWLAKGLDGVLELVDGFLDAAPFVALLWTTLTLLPLVLPTGEVATIPLLVGGLAAAFLLVRYTDIDVGRAVAVAVVIGGFLMVWRPNKFSVVKDRPTAKVVRIGNRSTRIAVEGEAPFKLTIIELFGRVTVDFTAAHFPSAVERIYLDLTVVGGTILVIVPRADWTIIPGRIMTGRKVDLKGRVDLLKPVEPDEETPGTPNQLMMNLSAHGTSNVTIERR
jgi:hypothetical protein